MKKKLAILLTALLGLALLVAGAEIVVRFATKLARRLHVPPIVIGLTVLSIGTSMPELGVGITGMQSHLGNLVFANIVGTNVVNILLIFGLSALIRPIAIHKVTMRLELPAIIATSVLLVLLTLGGSLAAWQGAILLAAGIAFLCWVVITARHRSERQPDDPQLLAEIEEVDHSPLRPGRCWLLVDILLTVAGLAVIKLGADWFLDGAVGIASDLGISDTMIGLTVVAIGTSAPELFTTVVATVRGKRDLAIGDLLGSSVLNLTVILGGSSLFLGRQVLELDRRLLTVNLPIMAAVAVILLPIFLTGRRVTRTEGGLMVAGYAAYLTFLISTAT